MKIKMLRTIILLSLIGVYPSSPSAQSARPGITVTAAPVTLLPDANRTPLTTLREAASVQILGEEGGWYRVSFKDPYLGDRVGYIRREHVKVAEAPKQEPPAGNDAVSAGNGSASSTPSAVSGSTGRSSPDTARTPARTGEITIFVRGVEGDSGFTDPSKDRRDSIKDLQKKIRDSKVVTLASSAETALVTLEVLGRETKRESNVWTAIGGSRQNKSYLTVRIRAGEFETEFSGESGSKGMLKGYGDAAGKVVKQLEEWVKANRDRLLGLQR